MGDRNEFDAEEEEFLQAWQAGAPAGNCPPPDLIMAASGGNLPADLKQSVSGHLVGCPICRVLARDSVAPEMAAPTLEEEKRIYDRIFRSVKPAGSVFPGYRWWLRPVPVFALAALGVALSLFWVQRSVEAPGQEDAIALRREPVRDLPMEKPPVRADAFSLLLWRGNDRPPQQEYLADLNSALESYRKDDFPEAIRRLESVTGKYPGAAEARFYLGISCLLASRDREGIVHLEQVQKLASPLRRDAEFYLGLAFARLGQRESALTWLRKICQEDGEYQARACDTIRRLEPSPR